jgi:hypothetical protein
MARKSKKRTKRRRKAKRTRPLVSQSARQVVVINPPAQRRKKSGRRKRRTAQTINPFIAAQFIPQGRHYFSGNQKFADSLQSKYDQLLIENKIKGQYTNLEKKLESFGELNRTVSANERRIRQLANQMFVTDTERTEDTERTPHRRRNTRGLDFDAAATGGLRQRTRQTSRETTDDTRSRRVSTGERRRRSLSVEPTPRERQGRDNWWTTSFNWN